ncbi:visual pigment-like receptor peropsin [Lineus longissimus]|uniref:visual pigment-like receptor peropsin n=1 Tax=Lineus longissimus TaxID=88925 RepID=UPI002B4D5B25
MEPFVVGMLYLIIGTTGVLSNLVILVTFINGNVIPSPKHVLHAHFAVANIGVIAGSAFPSLSIMSGRWLFGEIGCQAYGFEGFLFGVSAIGFVVALGLERYLINTRPDKCSSITTKQMHLFAMVVWAQGLFWATMPLLGWSRYTKEPTGTSCTIDWTAADDNHVSYITSLTTFGFGVPVLVVGHFLLQSYKTLRCKYSDAESNKQGEMSEIQLLKIVTFILLMTLVMWSPYAFNCMYSVMIGGDQNPSLLRVALPALCAKGGTTFLPLIYPAVSLEFRQGLKRLFVAGAKSSKKK